MKASNPPAPDARSLAAALVADIPNAQALQVFSYRGMCDASAAAALGPDLFVVANDERNQLKIYRRETPDPVDIVDLSDFLGTKKDKESDLEGAATVGQRIYWISSHSRNKKGELKERRHRFFATEMRDETPLLVPVEKHYDALLQDLIGADQLKGYALAAAAELPPEASGAFNIEGLAAAPDGSLLIGMRNPAPRGKALIVQLLNPAGLVEGKDKHAKFGKVAELDLGGRAIRSMELLESWYLIVAGPPADSGDFALYRWSGESGDAPVELGHANFSTLRPEALFAIPGTNAVQILSDDGGEHCKELDEAKQTFQGVIVTLA